MTLANIVGNIKYVYIGVLTFGTIMWSMNTGSIFYGEKYGEGARFWYAGQKSIFEEFFEM